MKIYQYPKCSTCRKASKWLASKSLDFNSVNIVEGPPSVEELRGLWERSGLPLKKFFNTSGQSYRNGGFKEKLKAMTEEASLEALAADGKLIKRPILDAGKVVLVGFKEADWDERIS